jgi:hypothetical protein
LLAFEIFGGCFTHNFTWIEKLGFILLGLVKEIGDNEELARTSIEKSFPGKIPTLFFLSKKDYKYDWTK